MPLSPTSLANAVATVVVSRWENGLDYQRLHAALDWRNCGPDEAETLAG